MSDHTLEGTLEHYGVKGMRWGVRRSDGSSKPPLDPITAAKRARNMAIGKEITKGVMISAAGLTVTALTGQRLAGAGTSMAISATLQGIQIQKQRGQVAAQQLMDKRF